MLLVLLVVLAVPAPALAGGWVWPLAGMPVVDRPFTPPATSYGAGHRGVDLRAAVGAPVRAAGAGQVSYAGLLAGRGVVVVVHAGGLRTTYEPVSAAVRVGQQVNAGQQLGVLTTGHASCRAGSPCLHWGLLRGEVYLDPLSLVGQTPLRLLPLGTVGMPPRGAAAPSRTTPAQAVPDVNRRDGVDRPLAMVAALGLATGAGLLARRPGPASRSAQVPPPRPPRPGASTQPVDLERERRRRRTG